MVLCPKKPHEQQVKAIEMNVILKNSGNFVIILFLKWLFNGMIIKELVQNKGLRSRD